MKNICPLLVIAAVCCFAPAMSNLIRHVKDEHGSVARPSCLQKTMNNNEKATDSVIEFLCANMKFKDVTDKEELIKAIQRFENDIGCTIEDIFGTSKTPEQVAMDENGVLTSQIVTMKQLLEQRGVPFLSVAAICLLDNDRSTDSVTHTSNGEAGQGNKRTTRDISKILGGLSGGSNGGLGGLLSPLNIVTDLLNRVGGGQGSGGLLSPLNIVTDLLNGVGGGQGSGGLLRPLNIVTDLLNGVGGGQGSGGLLRPLNIVTDLLNGVGGGILGGQRSGGLLGIPLESLLGGGQKQGDGLLCGLSGTVGQVTGGLGGLTGILTALLNGGGGGGSTGRQFAGGQKQADLLGNVLGGLGGLTGTVGQLTQGLGGLTGGLTGGILSG